MYKQWLLMMWWVVRAQQQVSLRGSCPARPLHRAAVVLPPDGPPAVQSRCHALVESFAEFHISRQIAQDCSNPQHPNTHSFHFIIKCASGARLCVPAALRRLPRACMHARTHARTPARTHAHKHSASMPPCMQHAAAATTST